ncbi:MAG TPA: DUF2939 domain-containing protein [Bradyrhizobium sp.]|jgi:hypothetical protein|uniref:DUF2939 domain-containing protein n=1 Tax=Bradyrhizobium sp. TaxID=376 RepID=UPI002CE9B1C8|nr:DUF2939 domain-containing protein [Bradyrhizobium sp.]HTB00229.1 DUF2939 domain-containing protein [Bradyrhizobium sp.]
MRWFLGGLAAFAIALVIYVGSAILSLNGLVEAVRAGDGAAILSRTDLPRLRHSLVDQIVFAYLKRVGRDRPVKPMERLVASTYGATIADAMVGKMLTADNLTQILRDGRVAVGETDVNLQRLSDLDASGVLQKIGRLSFVKPVEFQVRLGDGDDAGGISLHFEGFGWKLSGVQLPAAAIEALVQRLSDKNGR